MRTLRACRVFIRANVLRDLQHPGNFYLAIVQSVISSAAALFLLNIVLSRVNSLRGWTHPQLLVVLGVYIILGGFVRAVVRPSLDLLFRDIDDGNLDHVLLKPVDSQILISVRGLNLPALVDVGTGTLLAWHGTRSLDSTPGAATLLLAVVALLIGVLILYGILMILATTAFWSLRPHHLLELYDGIWSAARWPIDAYPRWLRAVLGAVVPVGVAVSVPAQLVTSRSGLAGLGGLALVCVVVLGIARCCWCRGTRHYAGASA
jgi:ABC-2 type transport system permease protein